MTDPVQKVASGSASSPDPGSASGSAAAPEAKRETALVSVPELDAEPRRRRRRWPWVTALVLLALAGAALLQRAGGAVPSVPVAVLAPGPVERVLIVSGRTESALAADLSSAVAGTVLAVGAEEGTRVAKGAELVRLDDGQARAALRQAVAALDAAILRRQQAEDDARRAEELGAVVPKVERERAAKALAQARAEEERLSAAVDQARLALDQYRLRAPFAGTVMARAVDPGETVQPGKLLVQLADLGQLRVGVEVDEGLAAAVQPGQSARVQLAGRAAWLAARVAWVAPQANAVTGTVPVRISFARAPEGVQLGLTAVVNIVVARSEAALTVPRTALVEGPAVFVLREGRAVKTPVRIIDWPAERVEVTEGLTPGDAVILTPEGLSDGQPVTAAQAG